MERLQKILAHAGIASRRKCEELIVAGRVRVNGTVVSELGTKVDPEHDRVEINGKAIRVETKTYIVLHKPRGYLSDIDEARGKPLAVDLVSSRERLYPAGRLDANSEGLLLLTNDGELAHRITHPRFQHEKEYLALVEGAPTDETLARVQSGVLYQGERLRADSVTRVKELDANAREHGWHATARNEYWLRIILHEGKKREIRHLCGAVGHPVKRLIRVRIGPVKLGALRVGQSRALTAHEIRQLKRQATITPSPNTIGKRR
ncbi:MAG: rRNA pseudouridine synthase [Chloroflexi bacterium]|nr:rRNA pseudouridine synthase [Chloroflexota bacterium]